MVAFVRSHGAESVKTAGTTDTYAITSLVPAGNLLVMYLVHDNSSAVANAKVFSISKPASETASWAFLGRAQHPTSTTAGAFANGEIWAIKTTVAWPNATSLTVSFMESMTMKAQNILEFSGAEATVRTAGATTYSTTTTPPNATIVGTTVVGDLVVGLCFHSNTPTPPTVLTAGWAMTALGSSGQGAATNNAGSGGYSIVSNGAAYANGVGGQTSGSTAGAGAIIAVLQATPAVTPVASFTASASTVASGKTVTFTDTSTNSPTMWTWNFGTGASPGSSSSKGPHTVTYSTVGTSTVTLTAGNTAGSDASDPTSITVTEGAPKIETLVDTFDTTLDKTTKWSGSAAQVVWDSSGRAKIPSTTAYYSLATPMAGGYRLTGSSVLAQLTLPPTSATRESFMEVFRAGVSTDRVSMYVSGTNIAARRTIGTTHTAAGSTPYNATTHAWWRIRESGGLVYFDTSSDGLSWNNLGSIAPGWDISDVWLGINSGYYSTGTAMDAFVDNVNAPPAPEVPDGRPKVWTGSAWVKKPVKVWTGSAWVEKPMKVWTGSQWKLL